MNKTLVLGIIVAVAVVVVAGVGIYADSTAKNEAAMVAKENMEKEQMMQDEATKKNEMMEKEKEAMTAGKESMMKKNIDVKDGATVMKKDTEAMMDKGAEGTMVKEDVTMVKKDDPPGLAPLSGSFLQEPKNVIKRQLRPMSVKFLKNAFFRFSKSVFHKTPA